MVINVKEALENVQNCSRRRSPKFGSTPTGRGGCCRMVSFGIKKDKEVMTEMRRLIMSMSRVLNMREVYVRQYQTCLVALRRHEKQKPVGNW